MPRVKESEMEEGEIVDELDDLSDISSEEEFLLRQRLEVLENYNNVLERKKAKRSSMDPGTKPKRDILCDLSEISTTELEDSHNHQYKKVIVQSKPIKHHNKQKRRKDSLYVNENNVRKKKESQKKKNSRSKRKLGVKVISGSSDESEDEYRNKRKKLADAVIVYKGADKSSLSARLHKMCHWSDSHVIQEHKNTDTTIPNNHITIIDESLSLAPTVNAYEPIGIDIPDGMQKVKDRINYETIEVSTDDDVKIISDVDFKIDDQKLEENTNKCQAQPEKDSDEDLELLREHALKSKPKTTEPEHNKNKQKPTSEGEDSDTTELRLICLKSALLKKAMEMKRKQKMQKKLSQSSNLEDDLLNGNDPFSNKEEDNNTDIESVDMDIGSDTEEKTKKCSGENEKRNNKKLHVGNEVDIDINCAINDIISVSKADEFDDDEDLLRAKLLTSLSKNLTNLVNPEVLSTIVEVEKVSDNIDEKKKAINNSALLPSVKTANIPEAKKFIIKLDGSDSEGEHEATKNLTKMHLKLSEQIDFQQKLDLFLKSTRMEVEKKKHPDIAKESPALNKPIKFVPKTVNNLPKSEQIEYKNLVRRMAELEKIKHTRQATLNLQNQQQHRDNSLKPRDVAEDTQPAIKSNIEEQIAKSRKTIAEESAKVLKLKEEATKLSQRHKIAATELRNITTAIALNKKQQKSIQISLSKIRLQHQSLLKSSTFLHSNDNGRKSHLSHLSNKVISNKLPKENNTKDKSKDPPLQKTLKVGVVNNVVHENIINYPRLSVQLDVTNNKKVIKIPCNPDAETNKTQKIINDTEKNSDNFIEEQNTGLSAQNNDMNLANEKGESVNSVELLAVCDHGNKRYYISVDDYKSPLDALGSTTWQADPNAILCPFEVGGQCKDLDCKYLHILTQTQ